MTPKTGQPYIWVTWLTGLLAGDKSCVLSPWVKTHFKYDKVADDKSHLQAWAGDHVALVTRRVDALRALGYTVQLEGQNAFKWEGKYKSAIIAGKPDYIAIAPDGDVIIGDGKTGRDRGSDLWQVLLYLLAIPRTHRYLDGLHLRGEVLYPTLVKPVPLEMLTDERKAHIFATIRQVADRNVRPAATPSENDCRYCDVAECAARATPVAVVTDAAAEF